MTVQVDADDNVYGFLDNLPLTADVVMDGIQKDHSIDCL